MAPCTAYLSKNQGQVHRLYTIPRTCIKQKTTALLALQPSLGKIWRKEEKAEKTGFAQPLRDYIYIYFSTSIYIDERHIRPSKEIMMMETSS
jgi:hypothetical protein